MGCGFVAVYHVEARESLCTINANDPRPKKGDTTVDIDCFASAMLAMTFPQSAEIRPKEPLWAAH